MCNNLSEQQNDEGRRYERDGAGLVLGTLAVQHHRLALRSINAKENGKKHLQWHAFIEFHKNIATPAKQIFEVAKSQIEVNEIEVINSIKHCF